MRGFQLPSYSVVAHAGGLLGVCLYLLFFNYSETVSINIETAFHCKYPTFFSTSNVSGFLFTPFHLIQHANTCIIVYCMCPCTVYVHIHVHVHVCVLCVGLIVESFGYSVVCSICYCWSV